jgi:hypothetical protein
VPREQTGGQDIYGDLVEALLCQSSAFSRPREAIPLLMVLTAGLVLICMVYSRLAAVS